MLGGAVSALLIMKKLYEGISTRWAGSKTVSAPTAPRAYRCRCGRPVFFRNSRCLACGTPLGYEPELARVYALVPEGDDGDEGWRLHTDESLSEHVYRRCANFDSEASCNWLIDVDVPSEAEQTLCRSCRLNRMIPDLSIEENGVWWSRIELAKRRLISSLIALGLPVKSRNEDPDGGLAFDFMRETPGGPRVLTGHDDGIITLNIEEADDAKREATRITMHEPYRTLLGHLRHEVGHYYWQRLVDGSQWHEPYRELFGDERDDYAESLKRHYDQGPPPDWPLNHVSAYASTHPWEDWAETWAHYLHMVDTLDTALSFGVNAEHVEHTFEPFGEEVLYRPDDPAASAFLSFVNAWIELTSVLNELSRSMGQPDFYPFVLSAAAVTKLHFIHLVVADAIGAGTAIDEASVDRPREEAPPAKLSRPDEDQEPAAEPEQVLQGSGASG